MDIKFDLSNQGLRDFECTQHEYDVASEIAIEMSPIMVATARRMATRSSLSS
jgi:hypothetical protein